MGQKKGKVIWLTGLSGSGKSTIANELAKRFRSKIFYDPVVILDGDVLRDILPATGFTIEDRYKHVIRTGKMAKMLSDSGVNVICALISPFNAPRIEVGGMIDGGFVLVYVKCSLRKCMARDVKGLYKKALNGDIENFTGVSQAYEEPPLSHVVVNTEVETVGQSVDKIWRAIKNV